jgi:hypothetical protein
MMINNFRRNKRTMISGGGLLHPFSSSLYTITESHYLETINNDNNDDDKSTLTVEEDEKTIQTTTSSFANEDESDDDNDNDDDDTTLLSLPRWDTGSRSSNSNSSPPTRPVRRKFY